MTVNQTIELLRDYKNAGYGDYQLEFWINPTEPVLILDITSRLGEFARHINSNLCVVLPLTLKP